MRFRPELTDIKLWLFRTDFAFKYLIKRQKSKNSAFSARSIIIDEPAAFSRVSSTFLFVNSAFIILFFRPKQIRSIESHSLIFGILSVSLFIPEIILALEQFHLQRIFIICDGQLTFNSESHKTQITLCSLLNGIFTTNSEYKKMIKGFRLMIELNYLFKNIQKKVHFAKSSLNWFCILYGNLSAIVYWQRASNIRAKRLSWSAQTTFSADFSTVTVFLQPAVQKKKIFSKVK